MNIWHIFRSKSEDHAFFDRAFGALREYKTGKTESFKICTLDRGVIHDIYTMASSLEGFHTTKQPISTGHFWTEWLVCLQNPQESNSTKAFLKSVREAEQQVEQNANYHFANCTADQKTIYAFHNMIWSQAVEAERFHYNDDDEGICVHTLGAYKKAVGIKMKEGEWVARYE